MQNKTPRFIPIAALNAALDARSAGMVESSAMVSVCEAVPVVRDYEVQEAVRLAYAF